MAYFKYSPQSQFIHQSLAIATTYAPSFSTSSTQFRIPAISRMRDSTFKTFVKRSARFDLVFS